MFGGSAEGLRGYVRTPLGGRLISQFSHGLRRGLYSCAALRLKTGACHPTSVGHFKFSRTYFRSGLKASAVSRLGRYVTPVTSLIYEMWNTGSGGSTIAEAGNNRDVRPVFKWSSEGNVTNGAAGASKGCGHAEG
jgi:hypothetical protein